MKTAMQLTSSGFSHNESIPTKYTCDGADVSPPLAISGVSSETKSLVLIMDDPDVPTSIRPDGMWDHWVVFNIPPETEVIPEGQEPAGIHGTGTSGNVQYHGPCPPDGEHHYFFKIYALDTLLDLAEGASKTDVERAMDGHIIDQTTMVGLYQRN